MLTAQGPKPFLPDLAELRLCIGSRIGSEFSDAFTHVAALPSLRRLAISWGHGYNAPLEPGALTGLTKLT